MSAEYDCRLCTADMETWEDLVEHLAEYHPYVFPPIEPLQYEN